jgi:hypothetical protein
MSRPFVVGTDDLERGKPALWPRFGHAAGKEQP